MSYPGQGYHSYGQGQQENGYAAGPPPPQGGYYQGYPPPPPPAGYGNQGYNQGYDPNGYNQQYQNNNVPPVPPHPSRGSGSNQGRYAAPSEGLGQHNQNNYQTNANYGGPAQNMGPTSMSYQAPPSGNQQFTGNAQGYNYQYSNCTGRRKALLIGINYIGSSNQLRGCINDVKNLSNFLNQRYNYQWDDMVILTDDQQNSRSQPTRANILSAMQWLVKDAHPNDSLVFQYSGHGGQTKDLDGDEEDGYDEVIYPVDFQQAGHIVDDDMHAIMVRSLPPGCRLTALFDSCHSGTALDLPYVYSTQGIIKEPNLAKEAGEGLLSAITSYARGDLGGVFSSITGVVRQAGGNQSQAQQISRQTKTAPADAISLSGCKDSQTSADTQEAGKATGAMSYAFVTVLSQNPNQSYLTLLQNMRAVLKGKYAQKPQLSASHPIDVNLQFIM